MNKPAVPPNDAATAEVSVITMPCGLTRLTSNALTSPTTYHVHRHRDLPFHAGSLVTAAEHDPKHADGGANDLDVGNKANDKQPDLP